MGFIGFLMNLGKVVVGGLLFLIAAFALPNLMMQGQTMTAAIIGAIGMIGLLYAIYQRGQLSTVR